MQNESLSIVQHRFAASCRCLREPDRVHPNVGTIKTDIPWVMPTMVCESKAMPAPVFSATMNSLSLYSQGLF